VSVRGTLYIVVPIGRVKSWYDPTNQSQLYSPLCARLDRHAREAVGLRRARVAERYKLRTRVGKGRVRLTLRRSWRRVPEPGSCFHRPQATVVSQDTPRHVREFDAQVPSPAPSYSQPYTTSHTARPHIIALPATLASSQPYRLTEHAGQPCSTAANITGLWLVGSLSGPLLPSPMAPLCRVCLSHSHLPSAFWHHHCMVILSHGFGVHCIRTTVFPDQTSHINSLRINFACRHRHFKQHFMTAFSIDESEISWYPPYGFSTYTLYQHISHCLLLVLVLNFNFGFRCLSFDSFVQQAWWKFIFFVCICIQPRVGFLWFYKDSMVDVSAHFYGIRPDCLAARDTICITVCFSFTSALQFMQFETKQSSGVAMAVSWHLASSIPSSVQSILSSRFLCQLISFVSFISDLHNQTGNHVRLMKSKENLEPARLLHWHRVCHVCRHVVWSTQRWSQEEVTKFLSFGLEGGSGPRSMKISDLWTFTSFNLARTTPRLSSRVDAPRPIIGSSPILQAGFIDIPGDAWPSPICVHRMNTGTRQQNQMLALITTPEAVL